jgi:hypothetical protein
VLIVQTALREPAYLPRTLASLERAGLERWAGPRALVADGYMPEALGWAVWGSDRCGQARTFFRALQIAAAYPDFSALTLVEDDIVLARNALDYIATVERDPAFVLHTWFTWQIRRPWTAPAPSTPFFLDVPLAHHSSNVAVTLSAATVRALLTSDAIKQWTAQHAGDVAYLGAFAHGRAAVHFPALVQHVGDVSAVGNVEPRQARHFLGEAQDAMELRCEQSV